MHPDNRWLRLTLALALIYSFWLPATRTALAQEEPGPANASAATPESVSFPGSYAHLLGGEDWEPADPVVQAGLPEAGNDVWALTVTLPEGDN